MFAKQFQNKTKATSVTKRKRKLQNKKCDFGLLQIKIFIAKTDGYISMAISKPIASDFILKAKECLGTLRNTEDH